MVRIYFIRHGETQENRKGIFRGRLNAPLNENGIAQSLELGKALAKTKFHSVYSSPLYRAIQTAEGLKKFNKSVDNIIPFEPFNNIDLGDWTGESMERISRIYPNKFQRWINQPERLVIPGGETLNEMRTRISKGLDKLKPITGNVAIVTHRSVLKVMFSVILGLEKDYFWRFHFDNASWSTAEFSDKRGWLLTSMNNTYHLSDYVEERV